MNLIASLPSLFISLLSTMRMNVQGLSRKVDIHLVKKFPAFEEPENSLPLLQNAANGYYPQPVQSSPHPYTLFPKIHFNIISPHTLKHNDNFN
jgi:hypothetical protein